MRNRRLMGTASVMVAYCLCMSRGANQHAASGPPRREDLVRLLREYERAFGLHVLTFHTLSKHFQLLATIREHPLLPPGAAAPVRNEPISGSPTAPDNPQQVPEPLRGDSDDLRNS